MIESQGCPCWMNDNLLLWRFHHVFTHCQLWQAESAPQLVLCWDNWAADQSQPEGLKLVEFFGADVDLDAVLPGGGPYLRTVYITPFRAIISAHRKANDEHIRVTGSTFRSTVHCAWQAHPAGVSHRSSMSDAQDL